MVALGSSQMFLRATVIIARASTITGAVISHCFQVPHPASFNPKTHIFAELIECLSSDVLICVTECGFLLQSLLLVSGQFARIVRSVCIFNLHEV